MSVAQQAGEFLLAERRVVEVGAGVLPAFVLCVACVTRVVFIFLGFVRIAVLVGCDLLALFLVLLLLAALELIVPGVRLQSSSEG